MKQAREHHPALCAGKGERMQEPETIQQVLALHALGWGTKRIAGELGAAGKTLIPLTKRGGWTIVAAIVWAEKNKKNRPHPLGGFAAVTLHFIPPPRQEDIDYIAAGPMLFKASGSVQWIVFTDLSANQGWLRRWWP